MSIIVPGYSIKRKIKDGGCSSVYQGVRMKDKADVALKVLSPNGMKLKHLSKGFRSEAKILLEHGHQHPKIVTVYEFLTSGAPRPTIVMEYFESMNLKSCIFRRSGIIRKHALEIMTHVCGALGYLHGHRIVHRDLKPENILVNEEGDIRLIDFSIALTGNGWFKFLGGKAKVMGTPLYMSPEQIRGESLDHRTDIYSLGVTFFEMITQKPPFIGASQDSILKKHLKQKPDPPSKYAKEIPDEINMMILEMLEKKPDKRPQSLDEVADRLKRFMN